MSRSTAAWASASSVAQNRTPFSGVRFAPFSSDTAESVPNALTKWAVSGSNAAISDPDATPFGSTRLT
jgi:hypothetical protein